jgi:SPOR domain
MMQNRLLGVIGTWVVLGLVSVPAQADPWYIERGMASYYSADSIGIVEQALAGVRVAVTEPPAAQQKDPDEKLFSEVQLGAFEESKDAEVVLEQVRDWFPKAYIVPCQGPLGPYYRVRIGPYDARERAQQVANALKRGGHRVFLDEVPESALPDEAPHPAGERS